MPGDQYEPNRVLGIPWTRDPNTRQDEEPQRVMGFPVDLFGSVDTNWLRRWRIPSGGTGDGCAPAPRSVATDEDEPGPER